jgi:hypothetical protein
MTLFDFFDASSLELLEAPLELSLAEKGIYERH